MQVSANKVVEFHYTLTNDAGDVLDSSEGGDPLAYLHGASNIIPGLENALEGKAVGDSFKVTVPPADGYGERSDALVQEVPRTAFQGVEEIEPGMRFQAQSNQGTRLVTVTQVGDESITVDANHPLAGENLNFAVEVTNVRDASEEEVEHGHVHGPEGHDH